MMSIIALPTMTASAPASLINFTCEGYYIPNPTANGGGLDEDAVLLIILVFLIFLIASNV